MSASGYIVIALAAGCIVAVWFWVRAKDRKAQSLLMSPIQWEAATGIQCAAYEEWFRQGIPLDKQITLHEFLRLADASSTRHRDQW